MALQSNIFRVVIDLISLLLVGIPVLIFYLVGTPYIRGFNCDDESIRYPYKDNTISTALLCVYSLGLPVITIIALEFVWSLKSKLTIKKALYSITYLLKVYNGIVSFAFGALGSQLATDIAKYTVGRLRPHFIDVCRPQVGDGPNGQIFNLGHESAWNCTDKYSGIYFTDYKCTNEKFGEYASRDAHLSFMSGHSSLAGYGMIYLALYLHFRLTWKSVGLLRPVFQCFCFYLAIYTGYSRISDYKHHWSDVLAGLIAGSIFAFVTVIYFSDLTSENRFVFRSNKRHGSIGGHSIHSIHGHDGHDDHYKGFETAVINDNPKVNYRSCQVDIELDNSRRN